jgi:hypothetical protein
MNHTVFFTIAIIAIASVGISPVFASNPYMGAYPHFTSETAKQFWFYTDFNGVHSASQIMHSLQSAAGAASGSRNGFVYQQAASVQTNENVDAQAQIYDGNLLTWQCSDLAAGCPELNSDVDNINYVYQTMYWDNARDNITFVYQTNRAGGTDTDTFVYPQEIGDNSDNFLVGTQLYDTTKRIKYYQFGVEASDEPSDLDTFQYDAGWVEIVGGTTFASSKNGYHTGYAPTSNTHHTWITVDGTTPIKIGAEDYSGGNANYEKKAGSSLGPDEVSWYDDVLIITLGTHLWDP